MIFIIQFIPIYLIPSAAKGSILKYSVISS